MSDYRREGRRWSRSVAPRTRGYVRGGRRGNFRGASRASSEHSRLYDVDLGRTEAAPQSWNRSPVSFSVFAAYAHTL